MSITLKRTGFCVGCPCIDIDVQTWWYDKNRDPSVSCKNEEICEMWLERIPKEKKGLTDGETEFITGNETFKKAFAAGWNACIREMKKWEE